MSDWQTFLQQQGARVSNGVVTDFGESSADYEALLRNTLLMDLGDRGCLQLEGPESVKFLQGQVTCDVNNLTADSTLTGALCTPKGRMVANFRLLRDGDRNLRLLMPADLVENAMAVLMKYAVFSKTTLTNASAAYRCLGLYGPNAEHLIDEMFTQIPKQTGALVSDDSGVAIRLHRDRFMVICPKQSAMNLWKRFAAGAKPTGTPIWRLLDIRSGLGEVSAETTEMFIPQMLNLQAIGGISFRKGCYTGQEVVARMQYLGRLKRRLYRLQITSATSPAPATPCRLPDNEGNAGNVVNAVCAGEGVVELLAVLTDDAAASDRLQIGDHAYHVAYLPLPYSIEPGPLSPAEQR